MRDTALTATWIRKKQDGTISAEELLLLEGWANSKPEYKRLLDQIDNGDMLWEDVLTWKELEMEDGHGADHESGSDRIQQATFARIQKQVAGTSTRTRWRPGRRFFLRSISYAASLLLIGFIGYFSYQYFYKDRPIAIEDLDPASNRARITLSNGQVIDLDETKSGLVLDGEKLRYNDGSLIVSLGDVVSDAGGGTANPEQIIEGRMVTPKGGKYQLTLSDGTEVWLNAGTSLTYPTQFTGEERSVQLEGEAYFTVAAQFNERGERIPFVVRTGRQEIKVLGTEFNVMAHQNDAHTHTTLVEGKVQVFAQGETIVLRPGEQAVSGQRGTIRQTVEIARFIAWKNNEFYFSETPLQDAVSELSRWYDFDVIYENEIPKSHLYGSISRNESLAEVLRIMESGGVRFRLERVGDRNRLVIQ